MLLHVALLWITDRERTATEELRNAVGQQALPNGPHCSTSGASQSYNQVSSLVAHRRIKPHAQFFSLTTQSPKRRLLLPGTSWRATECGLYSDGGELKLIDSICRHFWGVYTRLARRSRDASFTRTAARAYGCISNPDFPTSGADVITCHQPQQVFYFYLSAHFLFSDASVYQLLISLWCQFLTAGNFFIPWGQIYRNRVSHNLLKQ